MNTLGLDEMEKLKEYLNPGSKEEEEAKEYVEQLRELLTHDCDRGKKEGDCSSSALGLQSVKVV